MFPPGALPLERFCAEQCPVVRTLLLPGLGSGAPRVAPCNLSGWQLRRGGASSAMTHIFMEKKEC